VKASDAFRAMLGGAKMRRRAWPPGAYWAIDIEDRHCHPIMVGPRDWLRKCIDDERWCGHQWRGKDWEELQ
jgi:hypothetical protein